MMGTNYYLIENVTAAACPTCGKQHKEPWRYHIGKSSAGWCFAIHVDEDEGIQSLDDLLPKFIDKRYRIEDEYGEILTAVEMCQIIMARYNSKANFTPEFLAQNFAMVGTNNMLRATHQFCAGHGDGTWDYYTGEFS
jgi:hypothetical protein